MRDYSDSSPAHITNFHPRLGWIGNMTQDEIKQKLRQQEFENISNSSPSRNDSPTTDENFNRKCDYYYG